MNSFPNEATSTDLVPSEDASLALPKATAHSQSSDEIDVHCSWPPNGWKFAPVNLRPNSWAFSTAWKRRADPFRYGHFGEAVVAREEQYLMAGSALHLMVAVPPRRSCGQRRPRNIGGEVEFLDVRVVILCKSTSQWIAQQERALDFDVPKRSSRRSRTRCAP